jgi:hypothetical protein
MKHPDFFGLRRNYARRMKNDCKMPILNAASHSEAITKPDLPKDK